MEEEGFTPGNNLRRDALSVGGRAELSNKFTVTASLNYADTYMVSPPVGASLGGGDYEWSVFGNVFFTPRSVDLMGLPFEIPENGGSIYYYGSNQIIIQDGLLSTHLEASKPTECMVELSLTTS